MGNQNSTMGYYGVTGEGVSSYEDNDGFVVVNVSPANEDLEATTGPRSPFEPTPEKRVGEEKTTDLEGSVDSGFNDVQAAKCNSEKTTPVHVPVKQTDNDQEQQINADLEDINCRTAKSLGNHHAFFGVRLYQYSDTQCEGNKHILDNDL